MDTRQPQPTGLIRLLFEVSLWGNFKFQTFYGGKRWNHGIQGGIKSKVLGQNHKAASGKLEWKLGEDWRGEGKPGPVLNETSLTDDRVSKGDSNFIPKMFVFQEHGQNMLFVYSFHINLTWFATNEFVDRTSFSLLTKVLSFMEREAARQGKKEGEEGRERLDMQGR